MNTFRTLTLVGVAGVTLFTASACGNSVDIPDPTSQDYASQTLMMATHPGMDCVMEWVGQYVTNCYPMTVHPPYSVRVYYPHGCTCPPVQPRPNNYRAPRPIVVNKTTNNVTINKNTSVQSNTQKNTTVVRPPAQPADKIPPRYKASTTSGSRSTGSRR